MPTRIVTSQIADDAITGDKIDFSSAWQADWSAGSNKLTALAAGTADTDAVNKSQLDAVSAGLDPKESVRLATDVILDDNTSISGSATYNDTGGTSGRGQITATLASSDVFTVDGVSLGAAQDGTRVLLKNEDGSGTGTPLGGDANGIWITTISGTSLTLDRAEDFDEDAEVTAGAYMFVEEGTENADTGFVLITNDPITIGGGSGTSISFTAFSGLASFTAGTGLSKSGSTINFNTADTSLTVNADDVQVRLNATASGLEVSTGLRVLVDPTPATITLAAAGVSVTDPLRLSDNSASAPTYSFSGDTNTGMFHTGTGDELGFSTGGTERVRVTTTVGFRSNTNLQLYDSDNTQSVQLAVVANVTSDYTLTFPATGPSANQIMQLDGSGNISFVDLGSGGAGLIDGSGTANQVAYFSDADTITSDADFTFDGTNVSIANPMRAGDGAAGTPSYSFTNDTDSGLYYTGTANEIAIATNGAELVRFTASAVDFSAFVERSTEAGITASTTQTQGQEPLTEDVNELSTVANTNDTVTLPSAVAGRRITVINNGANTAQIFPASGDNLGAGVDTATTLPAGQMAVFTAYDATNWEVEIATNSVDGSGTANQVTYWSDSNTLTSDADFTFDGTNVSIANPMFAANGSAAAPSYSFTNDTNTGIFYTGTADQLGFAAAGVQVAQADATGLVVFDELGLVLRENDANGTDAVTIKALADLSSGSYTLTLPPDDGDADQVLKTDGSGVLDWVTLDAAALDSGIAGDGLEISGSALQIALILDTTSSGGGLTGSINGSNKVFTTSATPNGSLPVLVFRNGMMLDEGASEDFTRSGSTVTLTANQTAPVSGEKIHVLYYDS